MSKRMLILVVVGVAAVAGQQASAASLGECVTVTIDAPFRLPDGVLRPAGEITLCDSRSFSPIVELHAISVNGSTVGMFPSRLRSTETGPIAAPQVLFERDPEGTLDLIGYIVPEPGRSKAFRLRAEVEPRPALAAVTSGPVTGSPIAAIVAAEAH